MSCRLVWVPASPTPFHQSSREPCNTPAHTVWRGAPWQPLLGWNCLASNSICPALLPAERVASNDQITSHPPNNNYIVLLKSSKWKFHQTICLSRYVNFRFQDCVRLLLVCCCYGYREIYKLDHFLGTFSTSILVWTGSVTTIILVWGQGCF